MRIIADTNVLLRMVMVDDPAQTEAARQAFRQADAVVISRHAICEMVRVLKQRYKIGKGEIAAIVRQIRDANKFVVEEQAVDAGLAAMDAGADFADGVIACEGRWMGGEAFVSFDRKAVEALEQAGQKARLLG